MCCLNKDSPLNEPDFSVTGSASKCGPSKSGAVFDNVNGFHLLDIFFSDLDNNYIQ